jgi:hypothetical protein
MASAQIVGPTWISTTNQKHILHIDQDSLQMNKPPWGGGILRYNPPVWMAYQYTPFDLHDLPGRPNLSAFIPAFNGHYTFTQLATDTLLAHDTYYNGYYLYYRQK